MKKIITLPFTRFQFISFIVGMLIVVWVSAFSNEKKTPPSFETAWTDLNTALEAHISARGTIDSTATKAVLSSALGYVFSNWTDQQISNNVDALWPMPVVSNYHCKLRCQM